MIDNTTVGREPGLKRKGEKSVCGKSLVGFLEELINTTLTTAQFGAKRRRTLLETDTQYPSWLDKRLI